MLDLLGVAVDEVDGRIGLLWTEQQARAFMLLDVLPHELGHHRDLMTTRSRVPAEDPAVLRAQFAERHGQTPEAWIDGFKRGTVEDTPGHMDALVRAVALRESGTRAPAVTAPGEHPWAVAAFRRRSPGSPAG